MLHLGESRAVGFEYLVPVKPSEPPATRYNNPHYSVKPIRDMRTEAIIL